MQTDALIDFALYKLHIGRYLGTFVDTGVTPLVVRMVFGIEPHRQVTDRELFRQIQALMRYGSVTNPTSTTPKPPAPAQSGDTPITVDDWNKIHLGAAALLDLRKRWAAKTGRTESQSLMLTQIDIQDFDVGGDYSPFGDGTFP
jgi:hypothetical protein